jgi:hypothetical protein
MLHGTVYIGFDADDFHQRYTTGKTFANPNIGFIDVPATFVDSRGRIIIWYLPDLVPERIHVGTLFPRTLESTLILYLKDNTMVATDHLSEILRSTPKVPKPGKSVSWHVNINNFACKSSTRKCVNSAETFSAGWYAQAHAVSPIILKALWLFIPKHCRKLQIDCYHRVVSEMKTTKLQPLPGSQIQ